MNSSSEPASATNVIYMTGAFGGLARSFVQESAVRASKMRHTNEAAVVELQAQFDALENDLAQAQAMAADFQSELSRKTNALAEARHDCTKAREDLGTAEAAVETLTREVGRLTLALEKSELQLALQIRKQADAQRNHEQTVAGLLRQIAELESGLVPRAPQNDSFRESLIVLNASLQRVMRQSGVLPPH